MRSILVGFAVLFSCEAFSQTLEMYKTFGGAYFQYDTLYLSNRQVRNLLSIDAESSHEFKIAVRNYGISSVFGFGGTILLAIPIITAVGGGDPEWALLGGGAALIGVSIPLSGGYKRHAQAAVEGYNLRQQQQSRATLYFAGNGVKLKF